MYWHCDEELDLDHSWDLMDVLIKLEKDDFYTKQLDYELEISIA